MDTQYPYNLVSLKLWGCSQIMSSKNGGPDPPSPLGQPLSAFPQPPLPPSSAVSICSTPTLHFLRHFLKIPNKPLILDNPLKKKVHYLTKKSNMS